MEVIKEIQKEIQKPPPYMGYNEWAIFLDKTVHKYGYELVHIEDATIGIRPKSASDHVIVFPGSDFRFGKEIIKRMSKDYMRVIEDDLEYIVIRVNSKFPFVVSDRATSWGEDPSDTNPLIRYFHNKYPQEYVDKVFNYTPDIHDLIKSIVSHLGGA